MNNIRRLAPDEWQLLRETRLRALAESPLAFGRTYEFELGLPDAEWQQRGVDWACFVATDRDDVVGIIAGTWFDADAPTLHCTWVAPSHRGSGLAIGLVSSVIDWARSEGAPLLRMHVASDNEIAIRFYEKFGFEPTGDGVYMGSRPDVFAPELAMKLD